ncbi:aminopeptidase N-like [Paramacrobiotus metropolitanus]|uniref:aminopeptidase N-like n=1 Tax=Paramacrobiotus metropolitanus TaxID=2943436 RepID=UPI002445C995|nr:aminopeptidase N-like [Paramacrobiotus metropolitanus]XP_055335826.1 aminopeptidase N-like [Paramacrobiotus metropolitanus]
MSLSDTSTPNAESTTVSANSDASVPHTASNATAAPERHLQKTSTTAAAPHLSQSTTLQNDTDTHSQKLQLGYYVPKNVLVGYVMLVTVIIVMIALVTGFAVRSSCSPPTPHPAEGIIASNTSTSTRPDSAALRPRDIRLPLDIFPVHTKLEIRPILSPEFKFVGEVDITFICKNATRVLVLHAKDLAVNESAMGFNAEEGNPVPVLHNWADDPVRQFWKFTFKENLRVGVKYNVSLKFQGKLNDDLRGFYRSKYERDGTTSWIATTQFQPTDARRAFPCFDEPGMKSTFDITIVRPANMISISNMEIIRQDTRADNLVADVYNRTLPMSTYLLAFVVCEFSSKEKLADNGVKVRVWSRPDALNQAEFALDVACQMLVYFETYFGIPFPLTKLDLIAVPDFIAGAMENWGAVVFREVLMLYDNETSPASSKQLIAIVVAHEVAHQWFGNLVTPKWWDTLWLNEGFASFLEYQGVEFAFPSWHMAQQFVVDNLHVTFEPDALTTSHAISLPVYHPDEIGEIFDRISYGKGCSLIRMMRYFLGEETLKKGLKNYLTAFSYSNAEQDDLWRHLTEAGRQDGKYVDIKMVMDSWTLQMGYPVVTITQDHVNKLVKFYQQHFFLDNNATVEADSNDQGHSWHVPVSIITAADRSYDKPKQVWLSKENKTVNELLSSQNEWILANVRETGYYRVNYDERNWKLLITQLNTDRTKIDVINRAQIVDDALSLARAGYLEYGIALSTTEYLVGEQDFLPWVSCLKALEFVDAMMQNSEHYGLLKNYILRQLRPIYIILGWGDSLTEAHIQQLQRVEILHAACYFGHDNCVENAKQIYTRWMSNPEQHKISANLKSVVYCNAIRYGTSDEWDFAWEQYKKSSIAGEKRQFLTALTCSREPWILNRLLEWSLTSQHIRKQDGDLVMSLIAQNAVGRYLTWNFVRDRWSEIRLRYAGVIGGLSHLISGLTRSFNTAFELRELEAFIDDNRDSISIAQRALSQAVEKSKANISWRKRSMSQITRWLENVRK